MPPSHTPPAPEPVEFSFEDAMVAMWPEEPGDYLRLDAPDPWPFDAPPDEQP
jgi:hypothetical protein